MTNFFLIAICIVAGMLFRQSQTLPRDAHKGINAWIIYLALPAVSFKYLPHIVWSRKLLLPVLSPVIIWLGAMLFTAMYASKTKLDKSTAGGLQLATGLGNTSFVGFPLIMAYFGEQYIGIAVLCDQVTFLLLSTAGVMVAIRSAQKQTLNIGLLFGKVLRFPPFLGCVAALTIPRFVDISAFTPLFDKLAGTVGPLALFSIGLQLQLDGWRAELKTISAALFYKLIIGPLLIVLLALALHLRGITTQISIFEMAMATGLTVSVVADEYNLNSKLVNLIISIGLLVSFATTAAWWWLLQAFQ